MSDKELAAQEPGSLTERKREADTQVEIAGYWATKLMDIVEKCHMSTAIGEKKYLEVEGWQMIGEFAGAKPVIEWTRPWISPVGEHIGYEARVLIQDRDGNTVTSGESSCGFDAFPCRGKEGSEKDKAARSAAQTWAISRAYRNKYGYVAKLAGYEAVPAEEMYWHKEEPKKEIPACPKCGKPGFESKPEMGGGFYCWKKKGGCGHTWGQEPDSEGQPANGGPKTEVYQITPAHAKLYGLIEQECGGDMMRMGDMLAGLTAWKNPQGKQIPGKRAVGQITVKQAEYAIQHFYEQFGEPEPGSEG